MKYIIDNWICDLGEKEKKSWFDLIKNDPEVQQAIINFTDGIINHHKLNRILSTSLAETQKGVYILYYKYCGK